MKLVAYFLWPTRTSTFSAASHIYFEVRKFFYQSAVLRGCDSHVRCFLKPNFHRHAASCVASRCVTERLSCVKPISQLRFDYNTTTIRRCHDAFDYDGSDRNYDLRSIRLRYDDTTTTKN